MFLGCLPDPAATVEDWLQLEQAAGKPAPLLTRLAFDIRTLLGKPGVPTPPSLQSVQSVLAQSPLGQAPFASAVAAATQSIGTAVTAAATAAGVNPPSTNHTATTTSATDASSVSSVPSGSLPPPPTVTTVSPPRSPSPQCGGALPTLARALLSGVMATASHLAPTPALPLVESWSYKSTVLAAQTLLLAATAHGLSSAPVEGFDGRRVREVLGIPDRYSVPLVVALGYAKPLQGGGGAFRSARYAVADVAKRDSFTGPGFAAAPPSK